MERLEECAREADALVDITADEIKMANQWRAQYEHAQERYEAQFQLNAELIAGLKKAQAKAWDEGFDAGDRTARAVNAEWPDRPLNPYREAG